MQRSAERHVTEDNLGARALKSPSQKRLYNSQLKVLSLETILETQEGTYWVIINPFTAMLSLENDQLKCEI